jgi:threonine dehydrogenase-like Zn-dependent dehydrogenase
VGYLARGILAVEVELVDVLPQRDALSRELGVGFSTPERARGDRDLVFHASGTEAGLRTALKLVAQEGTVLELSFFGDREVSLPLGSRFHSERLTLRSSQVGRLSPRARPRYSLRERLSLALSLCRDPRLDALIDGESSFEDLPRVLPALLAPAGGALCHRVRYG